MKKLIISYILCSLVIFTLTGCGGISINLNPDANKKEVKQNQYSNDKQNISDSATQKESDQNKNVDNKSNSKDKPPQNSDTQNQDNNDKSNITVNITNDPPPAPEKKEIIIIRDQIPVNLANGGFIFPNSTSAYLTKNQVLILTNFQLGIARNEIYARHGYIFSLEQFKSYFNAQIWYTPTTKNVTLNNIEAYNVNLIKAEEDRRGIKWN